MRNQSQILIGGAIILFGLLFLIGAVFDVDAGTLCVPTGLILLGIWILVRPRLVSPDTSLHMRLFGPFRRAGDWPVADQEIWILVGDILLDFTEAEIPLGETPIRVFGFVDNVRVQVPEGVGVSASSTALISNVRGLGRRREGFVAPVHLTSDGYEAAERKIRLDVTGFIADLRVKQA